MGKSDARKALNLINGVQSFDGISKDSIDPAAYEVIEHYPDNGLEAAKFAVAAAAKAFRNTMWAHDHELRARVLEQLARAFESNRDRLLEILSLDNGEVKGGAALECPITASPSYRRRPSGRC